MRSGGDLGSRVDHTLNLTFEKDVAGSKRTPEVDLDELLEDYPVQLLDVEQSVRKTYYDENPAWPWYEKVILAPMRRMFALGAGTAFINNRFPEDEETTTTPLPNPLSPLSASISSSATEPPKPAPYFPDKFLEAPKLALPALLSRLSGWDGVKDDRGLASIVKPPLYEKFRSAHRRLAEAGCSLKMSMMPVEESSKVMGVWITFGDEGIATSTLLKGPLLRRYSRFAFTRRATNEHGKAVVVFREEVFEYCTTELEGIPTYATKNSLVSKGHLVGVDVQMDAKVLFELKDGEGNVLVRDEVVRPFASRFETTFFRDEFPEDGRWLVADVDSFLIDRRVREELVEPREDD
ncbi:hypothetical protein HDU67_009866 [Dinochytrium kinnereticum]|nr:hypothetical protein HDU67_009866 [Dinochytrium kinnereticum]